ncbi:MAG TPA: metalloregulator ArsR/SmtB family transcription factor [Rhodopila sp.]|jgi:DNA-binding transcriptional ArsR family regulator|nr:metalloregulator ArsR/SmtB family transcription factor [Rhodopila sp.]
MLPPDSAAPVFAALGDPIRLGIVARLGAHGPLSTMSLVAGTRVSRQGIAKHLRTLESAGIVRGARAGRDRVWELQSARFDEARGFLADISGQWDQALTRLQAFVETNEP